MVLISLRPHISITVQDWHDGYCCPGNAKFHSSSGFLCFRSPYKTDKRDDFKIKKKLLIHLTKIIAAAAAAERQPFSPSFDIFDRSMKCVPMTSPLTLSLSRSCILMRRHRGGNISVKTICSFHTGS